MYWGCIRGVYGVYKGCMRPYRQDVGGDEGQGGEQGDPRPAHGVAGEQRAGSQGRVTVYTGTLCVVFPATINTYKRETLPRAGGTGARLSPWLT